MKSTFALMAILLAAAVVRLVGLGDRTLQHVESYTPGLVYPAEFCDPCSRLTQIDNWRWAIQDVHGPAWYLWMLPYVQAAGTSLVAIRLPSAVLGVLAVWLTYLVGRRVFGVGAGLAGAALLALNAHHVYWSQTARMYSWACLLSLLSTYALLRVVDGGRWRIWLAVYLLGVFGGLSTIHYFWAVFVVQVGWVALSGRRVALLRWQLLAAIIASPLFTLIVYQARPSTLSGDAVYYLANYLIFGFAVAPNLDTGSDVVWQTVWAWGLPVLMLVMVKEGWRSLGRSRSLSEADVPAPPLWVAWLAAVVGLCVSLYAIPRAVAQFPHKEPLLYATLLAPWGFLAVMYLAGPLIGAVKSLRVPGWLGSGAALLGAVALVPPLLIAVVSLKAPLFAARGMTLFAPALLLLLGVALAGSFQINRWTGLTMSLVLLLAMGQSLAFVARDEGPTDYDGLASAVRAALEPGDVVAVRRHWVTTPLFYHLSPEEARYVAADSVPAAVSRMWFVRFDGIETETPANWIASKKLKVFGASAELYHREKALVSAE